MPREEMYVFDETFIADGAITANAVVVYSTTDGKVALPSGENASKIAGVAMEAVADGVPVKVRRLGVAVCIAASAFEPGDYLGIANAEGDVKKVVPAMSAESSEILNIVGQAEDQATDDGDEVSVYLNHFIATK